MQAECRSTGSVGNFIRIRSSKKKNLIHENEPIYRNDNDEIKTKVDNTETEKLLNQEIKKVTNHSETKLTEPSAEINKGRIIEKEQEKQVSQDPEPTPPAANSGKEENEIIKKLKELFDATEYKIN